MDKDKSYSIHSVKQKETNMWEVVVLFFNAGNQKHSHMRSCNGFFKIDYLRLDGNYRENQLEQSYYRTYVRVCQGLEQVFETGEKSYM